MPFLLIRILPFILPVFYFALTKLIFYLSGQWYVWLILILFLDFIYFFLLNLKIKTQNVIFLFLHSAFFISVSLVYISLLSSRLFINLFSVFWTLLYFIYLESIFHRFYQTKKILLFDWQNIISYINLLLFFLAAVVLINFYIFLNLPWWWVLLIFFPAELIMILNQILIYGLDFKSAALRALVIAFILLEFFLGVIFLPISFYVSALILTAFYYLLTVLAGLYLQKKLTKILVVQHAIFSLVVVALTLLTADWF